MDTEKKKRQRIKDGTVVRIDLSENKMVFGRLLVGEMAVYDFVVSQNDSSTVIKTIVDKSVLFYCCVYDEIITKGLFEIVGFKEPTQEEIDKVPPMFMQDLVDVDDCSIFYHDGRQYKARPQECIGLERSIVWSAEGLTKRIEDHYAGRRNVAVERAKVILSKDDPRYLPPPLALRWDFVKEVFYRTDK